MTPRSLAVRLLILALAFYALLYWFARFMPIGDLP